MSDTTLAPAPRRFNWLKAALIASLALNLLVVGGGLARWYAGFGPERYARLTQAQLIPRGFFRELDRPRRMELMAVLKTQDPAVRDGRQAVKAQVIAVADALEQSPYDPARVKAAVEGFTSKSEALFNTGAEAALAVIAQLTPEERALMAKSLRARETRPPRGADDKKPAAP